jgi:hypothetical protein
MWEELHSLVTSAVSFHGLHAVVSHPRDTEGEMFIRCLQRLGARVECQWPPAERVDAKVDFLICSIEPAARTLLETSTTFIGPSVIGILEANNA